MPPRLDVRTDAFDRAADTVIGDAIAAADGPVTRLVSVLDGCSGMAGSDPPARDWASAYDDAARSVLQATRSLFDATYRVAVLLEHTGANYDRAESASTIDVTTSLPHLRHQPDWRFMIGMPPPAGGAGSTDAPPGWGLVEDLVGYVWPNGHQNRLHAAADAWRAAACGFDEAAGTLPAASAVVATVTAPEVDDVIAVLTSLRSRYLELARAARSLARACEQLAAHIDRAHDEARHELLSLVAFTAGTEVAGAILSVVTAEIPAAADLAAIVARAVEPLLQLRPALAGVRNVRRAMVMESRGTKAARAGKTAGGAGRTAGRVKVISKTESQIWKGLKPYRGKLKTNGLKGKDTRYYEWDHRHGEIEVLGRDKKHLGVMDAVTEEIRKPAVKGRTNDQIR